MWISGTGYGEKLVAPSRVFFMISRRAPREKYKSSVRRLKRKQHRLVREKLAKSYADREKKSAVRQLSHPTTSRAAVVDGRTSSYF